MCKPHIISPTVAVRARDKIHKVELRSLLTPSLQATVDLGGLRVRGRRTDRPGGVDSLNQAGSHPPSPGELPSSGLGVVQTGTRLALRRAAERQIMTLLSQSRAQRPLQRSGRRGADNQLNLAHLIISSFTNSTNISGGSFVCEALCWGSQMQSRETGAPEETMLQLLGGGCGVGE